MKTKFSVFIATLVTVCSSSASADSICPDGLVCASKPETVVKAMQEAGFRAKLGTDKTGDPMVSSEASSYVFDIYFYGCEYGKNCTSLQFLASFGAEDDNTPEYANEWNSNYRFVQASVEKMELQLAYDVTTEGGLTKANFEDVTNRWSSSLGEFSVFVREQNAINKK